MKSSKQITAVLYVLSGIITYYLIRPTDFGLAIIMGFFVPFLIKHLYEMYKEKQDKKS